MPNLIVIRGDGGERMINLDNVTSGKRVPGDAYKIFTNGVNGGGIEVLQGMQAQLFEDYLQRNAVILEAEAEAEG
ncbi:MAG: hypothetical protein M0Z43_00290 [Acidithiobacillus sp.]|nr:hypothetical protein [Acidithiobacillus sp.]